MEEKLKTNLIEAIGKDFEILTEVPGRKIIDGKAVRVDFLAFPMPQLTKMGFPAKWFGIEVKHFADFHTHGRGKKAKLIWQAINYAQSEFYVKGEAVRPDFIALYIGEYLNGSEEGKGAYDWHVLMNLARCANVLEFQIRELNSWKLIGAGGTFFSRSKGPRNVKFSKRKSNWT